MAMKSVSLSANVASRRLKCVTVTHLYTFQIAIRVGYRTCVLAVSRWCPCGFPVVSQCIPGGVPVVSRCPAGVVQNPTEVPPSDSV